MKMINHIPNFLYYVSFKATMGMTVVDLGSLVPMINAIEYGSDLEMVCELLKEEFGATEVVIISWQALKGLERP
ncbi:hypothetical protein [Pseudomonas oryzihabitans]|uniref:hypothetical protein n=1 Tax=Pseudomonas oryzihabitans TaxID=47885 RepID=UPI002893E40D|nr:hypothetical protein [Pseudomonas oryzihabitans]MDT3723280.1 hypothetical protein [Pseudomonas oryzihabitans]